MNPFRKSTPTGVADLKRLQARPTKVSPNDSKTEVVPSRRLPSVASSALSAKQKGKSASRLNAFVVLGTYHSVMLGLLLRDEKFFLKFSIKHHVGCVNAVAVCSKYIATCGYDERVFLFTSKDSTPSARSGPGGDGSANVNPLHLADLGSLTPPHEVTCMQWASKSQFLLCGCSDGSLLAYRSRDWSIALHLPVHERRVNSMAVHPGTKGMSSGGGRLAVTVGSDRFVAVLDLISGKLLTKWKLRTGMPAKLSNAAYDRVKKDAGAAKEEQRSLEDKGCDESESKKARTEGLSGVRGAVDALATPSILLSAMFVDEPEHVQFSPEGTYFVISSRFLLLVYRTATMTLVTQCEMKRRSPGDEVHCFTFVNETSLFVGNESGQILFLNFFNAIQEGLTMEKLQQNEKQSHESATADDPESHVSASVTSCDSSIALVECRVPSEVIESQKSRGTDMTRLKYPYKHTTRIKALSWQPEKMKRNIKAVSELDVPEGSLFSVDTHGVVIAWRVVAKRRGDVNERRSPKQSTEIISRDSETVELQFLCSANCQGRVTSFGVMML